MLLVNGASFVTAFSQSAHPAAEIEFVEMKFRKPPLVELYFDVTLRNSSAESRWFILPSNLGQNQSAGKGGIDGVEVFAPHGKGRVVIGHFLGTGGFHALRLAAGAEVRMRLFPISFWGDPPDQLEVPVIIAKRLTIGGEPGEAWFGVDHLSRGKADIDESAQSQKRFVHARRTPDSKEVPTLIGEASRVDVKIALKTKH